MSEIFLDTLPETDLLGRKKLARQMVKSITAVFNTDRESFVVGVNGAWGSGKTTLLTYMEEALAAHYGGNPELYRIIRFNPWGKKSIDPSDLELNLLETVVTELELIQWKKGLRKKGDRFKSYLKYLNYIKFAKHFHPVANTFMNVVNELTKSTSVHSIEEIKRQADELIRDKGIRLYIFLDDLDRLDRQEVATVFRIIKLNINFLNTCFLIAYDKTIVSKCLDDATGSNGEKYLEKIVQVDFSIPEINDESIEAVFLVELKSVFASLQLPFEGENLRKLWKFYGLREYFRNLRDIKRYINSLIFSLPNITEEINVLDFLLLEAIKVFDHGGYRHLFADYLLIRRKAIWSSIAFDQAAIRTYPNETTQSLLHYLFVQKETFAQLREGSLNAKRLHDPAYFERYFTLNISETDISQDTFTQFLTIPTGRDRILREALQAGTVKNMLERLSDRSLHHYHPLTDYHLLETFIRFWDEQDVAITSELDENLWHAYFNLAHSYPNKYEAAKKAVQLLILEENRPQPMRFVFNYFLILFHQEGRDDQELRGDIKTQVDVHYPALEESFLKHLTRNWPNYLWGAERRTSPLASYLFIVALAKHQPEEYLKALDQYATLPGFQGFLVRNFFVKADQDGDLSRLDLERKDLLLPNSYWHQFLTAVKGAKKGTWDDDDQRRIDYLLREIEKKTT